MSEREIIWFPAGTDPNFPDGSEIVLEGDPSSPFREVEGADNFFVSPWDILENSIPGIDGTQFRSVRKLARDPAFRFVCDAPDHLVFSDAMQGLAGALTRARQPGTLVVRSRIGTSAGLVRSIRCMYASGLEGDALLSRNTRVKFWPFTLKFRAFDPYWYSPEPCTATWQGKPGANFFPFNPAAFIVPAGGMELVDLLEMTGDVESYGIYTLQGPWSRVKFTNDRTGLWWEKRRGLSNETLIVKTAPADGGDTRNLAGESRYGLTTGFNLFPIGPGDTISVEADGADASTRFDLSVSAAWLTAP